MFSIFRSQTALASLRESWDNADDGFRLAILEASRRIDKKLLTDPQRRGESREDGTRLLLQAPLAVLFEVDERRKLVRVLRTWAFGRRRSRKDR